MHKIIVIESFKKGLATSIERLQREYPEFGEIQAYLLTSRPRPLHLPSNVTYVQCDFSEVQLKVAFRKIGTDVKTVICRGDIYIQYLRRVLPYLSSDAFVSSARSLEAATNKRLMREAFREYSPEITPKFIKVDDTTPETIKKIELEVPFPIIIKPASLASSLMIQKCNDTNEVAQALEGVFSTISDIYKNEGRYEKPEVIVEEFLEGVFYSIDSYVLDGSTISHCPTVAYTPAKSIGIDDFFLYKRWTPVDITANEVMAAQEATKKAIKALGLIYTATHTELVRTKNGWKVIELGPRIGRFRNSMYRTSYGIDHGYNDLLVHMGVRPKIEIGKTVNSVAYSIYPHYEGRLLSVAGIDELPDHIDNIVYKRVATNQGAIVKQAKRGGHALAEIVFADEDKEGLLRQCDWFEKHVYAEVQPGEVTTRQLT